MMNKKDNQRQQKRKEKRILIIGFVLIIIGVLFIVIPKMQDEKEKKREEKKIEVFFEAEKQNLIADEEVSYEDTESTDYKMVLEIPSIGLKKGLYSINSQYNYIEYNVEISRDSDMPDVENGNFILMSHNGNSKVSYFEHLKELKNGDDIVVYYKSQKFVYQLDKSYDVSKNGTVTIDRNIEKNTITLITCKNGSRTQQTVYIGYLSTIE